MSDEIITEEGTEAEVPVVSPEEETSTESPTEETPA